MQQEYRQQIYLLSTHIQGLRQRILQLEEALESTRTPTSKSQQTYLQLRSGSATRASSFTSFTSQPSSPLAFPSSTSSSPPNLTSSQSFSQSSSRILHETPCPTSNEAR